MKIRIAAIVLVLAAAAACSSGDITAPRAAEVRSADGLTTFSPDSTPATDDGGGMMGSGSRTTP